MVHDVSLPRIRPEVTTRVKGGSESRSRVRLSYSGAAFESSLASMGTPQQRARRLAMEIRRGGAIVTVNAGSLNEDAERILERNHGRIRYEADTFAESERPTAPDCAGVQIFSSMYITALPGRNPLAKHRRKNQWLAPSILAGPFSLEVCLFSRVAANSR
jgi:hypothetical protein